MGGKSGKRKIMSLPRCDSGAKKVGGSAGARGLYKYHEKKSFTERRVLGGENKRSEKGI